MAIVHTVTSHWRQGVILGFLALILPVGWYVASPLFISHSVSEALPTARALLAETAVPRVFATGQFGVVDAVHHGQGTAKLLALPDGSHLLRLEDFSVTNGPDLYVYLSDQPAPRESGQLHEHRAFEVGQLKGNAGNQNYALPADLDLNAFASTVIYCRRFGVVFSTAQLLRMPESDA